MKTGCKLPLSWLGVDYSGWTLGRNGYGKVGYGRHLEGMVMGRWVTEDTWKQWLWEGGLRKTLGRNGSGTVDYGRRRLKSGRQKKK